MSAFFRLHPNLRHAIVHDLGWRLLRPVQEETADAVLDGCNAVVLAPTAGGKTEAAIFPALSRILSENAAPVSVLYICPIRALLNNQEGRLQSYARMVGLDAFKWHGDVSTSARTRFLREPSHILMITPESLEVMMISQKVDARRLFAGVMTVIIDEVHAFAGDDRGAHLMSLLERLCHFCGRDIQRIGLSATVGNPDEIGQWLQGSSHRPYRRVDPPRPAVERDLRLDFMEDLEEAARVAARLGQGHKSLVFVESRGQAERVGAAMAGRGVQVFIHHSAVSRADRQLAEAQFTQGENTAIVCTSTMELGIDVGDLDRVIQIDAPSSVAGLLQRMGRTGRRPGTRANLTLLATRSESLIQGVALFRLMEDGYVEDVRPSRRSAQVLAHQLLALTLQEGGISRHRVLPWLAAAIPFQALTRLDVAALVGKMLSADILYESEGLLSLGRRGEQLYGKRNFFELYAVFSSPGLLRVMEGFREVGTIPSSFLFAESKDEGPLCFRLGGKPWEVRYIDWERGTCFVHAADFGMVPRWLGSPRLLSRTLCQRMKAELEAEDEPSWLGRGAILELEVLRQSYSGLVEPEKAPMELDGKLATWHTFAGGAINRLLAEALRQVTHKRWTSGNLSVQCRDADGRAALDQALKQLKGLDWSALAHEAASKVEEPRLSKFEPCLPPEQLARFYQERMFDVAGAEAVLEEQQSVVLEVG